jgi:SAM-dependent methyltransferase
LKILEPGAGTGIFTRLLVAPPSEEYPRWNIDTLIGVEPSPGMREAWEKGLQKVARSGMGNVKIVDGTFDNFSQVSDCGVTEGTVDLIVIAQAWHWCPDHEAAFVSGPPLTLGRS